jgi:hypothetical protein
LEAGSGDILVLVAGSVDVLFFVAGSGFAFFLDLALFFNESRADPDPQHWYSGPILILSDALCQYRIKVTFVAIFFSVKDWFDHSLEVHLLLVIR